MNMNCSLRPITDKNFSSHITVSDLIAEIFGIEQKSISLEKDIFFKEMLQEVLFPFIVNALMGNINLG